MGKYLAVIVAPECAGKDFGAGLRERPYRAVTTRFEGEGGGGRGNCSKAAVRAAPFGAGGALGLGRGAAAAGKPLGGVAAASEPPSPLVPAGSKTAWD